MRIAVPVYAVGVGCWSRCSCSACAEGATRWLNLGVTTIQPSEIMKIAMPLMIAWYFHKHEAGGVRDYIHAGLLLGPVGLIAKQPDLGTGHSGVRRRHVRDLLRRSVVAPSSSRRWWRAWWRWAR